MLSEQEAKRRIQLALDNALDYIKHEQDFVFEQADLLLPYPDYLN